MRRLAFVRNIQALVPSGASIIGAGLLISGLSSYGFLAISARMLAPGRYSTLSALWALVFILNPGFFFPLEQEIARGLASQRDQTRHGRGLQFSLTMSLILSVVVIASAPILLDNLFEQNLALVAALVLSLFSYGVSHSVRGIVAGTGLFTRYAGIISSESLLRLGIASVLALSGIRTTGPYAFAIAIAPLIVLPFVPFPVKRLRQEPKWRSGMLLIYLITGSVFSQLLVNSPPLIAKLASSGRESGVAGKVLTGLIVARIPLFFFQAIQASLLPRLAGLAQEGRNRDFNQTLNRLLFLVLLVGVLACLAALLVGPEIVAILFGRAYSLRGSDMLILATASFLVIIALTLAQALIAIRRHALVAVSWMIGSGVLCTSAILIPGHLLKAETSFLLGALASATTLCILAWYVLKRLQPSPPIPLIRALEHEIVEP